ncbi:MAG: nucleoside deaminase [Chlamydiales bacterium]|nr:nucleoside deaminase [Chlamydiales bacterium]
METFINLAIKKALQAYQQGEVPVGAVIFKENTFISSGYNLIEKKKDASAHAEMIAIKKATKKLGDWRLNGCIMVCTLEPCIMCAGSLILHRLDRLIYLAKDYRHGANGSFIDIFAKKHPIHQIQIIYNTDYPIAGQLLKDFFAKRRKNEKWNLSGCRVSV